jgi:hypothetical protein
VQQECTWAGRLCLGRNGVAIARALEPGLFAAEAEPSRVPLRPFSTIGANLYLRWKEARTGRG